MSIVKKILKVLAAIIILLLIAAIFVGKEYAVERAIIINKPTSAVFNYVKFLKNQDYYSKWALMDPNMKKSFSGVDSTVGCISAWDSENKDLGKGEQEIKKITEGSRIDYELRFEKPMKDVADSYMTTEAAGADKTTVKWGIKGRMTYPFNLMGLFMDKMMGGDLEEGLRI